MQTSNVPDTSETAPQTNLAAILARQQAAFRHAGPPALEQRLLNLQKIINLARRHGEEFARTIAEDFGSRSPYETMLGDVGVVISAAKHAQKHLKKWMRAKRRPIPLHYRPARNRILAQPLGVVGIIAPWNYPLQLSLSPAIGALAAGNRVMLKPSELVPRTAALLADVIADNFPEDEFAVANGGPALARDFSALPFDHLIFTGSTATGRLVAEAAARNLTPVTLELGGKSPVILDDSADLAFAAPRIALGKSFNAGQTCVAPDYALVPEARLEEFAAAIIGAAEKLYPQPRNNPDYASIISEEHHARIRVLIDDAVAKGARVITAGDESGPHNGGPYNDRKLPLHLLLGVNDQMAVMREEIFGPVLPVLAMRSLDQAIDYINDRPRPLALYWFGRDKQNRDRVLQRTTSGGVTINDTLWHVAQDDLPFGGVGASGMGAYHGEDGFRRLSHEKPVLLQSRFSRLDMIWPPYGAKTDRLLKFLNREKK